METAEAGIKIIKEKLTQLTDDRQKEFFNGILDSLEIAKGEIDNDEKEARFIDAAIKYANQISFIVYRKTAPDFAGLPTPEETAAKVQEFNDARQKRVDEINEKHQEIFNEQKALDVFTGIIAGLSKEEAQKRMAEHEAKIREASKNM